MNTHDFARRYLAPYKTKGNEIVPHVCPFCKGGSSHDKETFALNTVNQTYNCKRGSCGVQGHFTQLCKEFGETAEKENTFEMYKPKKVFKKPITVVEPIISQVEEYLQLRKISKSTLEKMKVGSNGGNIVFPYYKNGELIFVKFRPAKKVNKGERKAWREEGTEPILWNMDNCTNDKPLFITEGEIDALSLCEVGFDNVCSIPSGTEDFTWLETCWEWIEKFKKVVICGDMDDAGREMVRKLSQKLGTYRVSIVELSRKDANEVLYYEGKESLQAQIKNAKDIPIIGLIELANVKRLDVMNMPTVLTGIKELDKSTGGSILGDLSVWTGKRGEGKSTLMGQLLIEAIEAGHNVCAYSGELNADRFKYWIDLQCAGKKNIEKYFDSARDKEVMYLKKDVEQKIENWYKGKFFLYDNTISDDNEETSILKVFEYAVKRYDCKLFLVDNLMTARYSNSTETDYFLKQIKFVADLIQFANKYSVHIHLVAHPKKTKGALDNDDISGRAEITNLAHNVYSVERVDSDNGFDVMVSILKNRWEGSKDKFGLNYCKTSKRLYPPTTGPLKRYGWETAKNPEWLDKLLTHEDDSPF